MQQTVMMTVGTFENDVNRIRTVNGPFRVVTNDGMLFVEPLSGIRMTTEATAATISSDPVNAILSSQMHYGTVDNIVIPMHRMGDGQDDWIGMHKFGWI
jgi:hypothetical protein